MAVTLAIAGQGVGVVWVVYIFKPMATALILAMAAANWSSRKEGYPLWVCAGLVFSLVGDVLLIWPERYFVAGLTAFLFAHIAYLAAFTRGMKFPSNWPIWMLYLAIGAAIFLFLNPGLPDRLKSLVALYAFALATMAAQAMGRYLSLRTTAARLAAVGGIFFVLSDGLLAVDRFRAAIPHHAIVVLVPYYIAQMLIALSTRPVEGTNGKEA